jgi:pyruvate dehydrogenase E1 component beta subunit
VTGEIAATIAEEAFDWLDAPIMRVGGANVPIPFSKAIEPLMLPDAAKLAAIVAQLLRGTR